MAENGSGVISKAIRIKGELHGEEDLIIEGQVEGVVVLEKHLTVDKTGVINADIQGKDVTIKGEMNGKTTALDKVEITSDAKVIGDVKAPRIRIDDGARFRGEVDMQVDLPPDLMPD